jgi:hypothetical protein
MSNIRRGAMEKQEHYLGSSSPHVVAPHAMHLQMEQIGTKTTVVYSTMNATWSSHELHILQKGLAQFSSERYDHITRCIKIAATLPDKCIRDVAAKIKTMQPPELSQHQHQQNPLSQDKSFLSQLEQQQQAQQHHTLGSAAHASIHHHHPDSDQVQDSYTHNNNVMHQHQPERSQAQLFKRRKVHTDSSHVCMNE